jgi:hypothetical protein
LQPHEERQAHAAIDAGSDRLLRASPLIPALREIEFRKSLVLSGVALAGPPHAHQRRTSQERLDARRHLVGFLWLLDRREERPLRRERLDRPRVLGLPGIGFEEEPGAIPLQRSAKRPADAAIDARGALAGDRIVGRERRGTHLRRAVRTPARRVGTGDDIHAAAAGPLELGGVRVATDRDAEDLVARRQAAAEPVDPNLRARAGQLFQLLPQHVLVVSQRFDLGIAERQGGAAGVLDDGRDGHLVLDVRQRQREGDLGGPGPGQLLLRGFEAGRGHQQAECRGDGRLQFHAPTRADHAFSHDDAVGQRQHFRPGDRPPGGIDHEHEQARRTGSGARLGRQERRPPDRERDAEDGKPAHMSRIRAARLLVYPPGSCPAAPPASRAYT